MRVEKALRQLYGCFFYGFPNGKSAADVYDKITGILLNNPFKTEEKCKLLHLQMEWSKMGSHSTVQVLVIISQQLGNWSTS
ncbi:hypothetical protein LR48_Vigan277s000800 [Vigna angularis]|uniref:Uncharacterized protein n=1 Tax=Phaseolus angularis TaxID=3914 RepID=A0A0L9T7E4_PHAAN|nr:hypothetical protein LR48_Vigan277s000800 [Vigna angularis]